MPEEKHYRTQRQKVHLTHFDKRSIYTCKFQHCDLNPLPVNNYIIIHLRTIWLTEAERPIYASVSYVIIGSYDGWNSNRNSNVFIQENEIKNFEYEMATILSRPRVSNHRENAAASHHPIRTFRNFEFKITLKSFGYQWVITITIGFDNAVSSGCLVMLC